MASDLGDDVGRPFQIRPGHVVLHVKLTPRGGRDSLEGVAIGADGRPVLQARVRALPEEGAANEALLKLVAKALRVPKAAVSIVSGATSRHKSLRIEGEEAMLAPRLGTICGG